MSRFPLELQIDSIYSLGRNPSQQELHSELKMAIQNKNIKDYLKILRYTSQEQVKQNILKIYDEEMLKQLILIPTRLLNDTLREDKINFLAHIVANKNLKSIQILIMNLIRTMLEIVSKSKQIKSQRGKSNNKQYKTQVKSQQKSFRSSSQKSTNVRKQEQTQIQAEGVIDPEQLYYLNKQTQNEQAKPISEMFSQLFKIEITSQDIMTYVSNDMEQMIICLHGCLLHHSDFIKLTEDQPHNIFFNVFKNQFQLLRTKQNFQPIINLNLLTLSQALRRHHNFEFVIKSFKNKTAEQKKAPIIPLSEINFYASQIQRVINRDVISPRLSFQIYSLFSNMFLMYMQKAINFTQLNQFITLGENQKYQKQLYQLVQQFYVQGEKDMIPIRQQYLQLLLSNNLVYEFYETHVDIIQKRQPDGKPIKIKMYGFFNEFFYFDRVEIPIVIILCTDFEHYQDIVLEGFLNTVLMFDEDMDFREINRVIKKYNILVASFFFNNRGINYNPLLPKILFRIGIIYLTQIIQNKWEPELSTLVRMVRLFNLLLKFSHANGFFCVACLEKQSQIFCLCCKKICRSVGKLELNFQQYAQSSQLKNYIDSLIQKLNQKQYLSETQLAFCLIDKNFIDI